MSKTVLNLRRMSLAWQIIHALEDRRVIATGPEQLRVIARTVLEEGGDALVCFRGSDNHVHTILLADRERAGVFGRNVANALHHRLRLPVAFEPTRFRPVHDQQHLYKVFGYVLANAEHHGTSHDLHFEASNLPDLLGMRELGARSRARVRLALPRIDRAFLLGLLGVEDLTPTFAAEHLVQAACAATALPSLAARTAEALAARVAVTHLALGDLSAAAIDNLLGVSPRTGARLRAETPDPTLTMAIRLQMDLRVRKHIESLTAPFGPSFASVRDGGAKPGADTNPRERLRDGVAP